MIRTQIYLPKQTYEELKDLARQESKSMAQKIREVLDQRLKRYKSKKKRKPYLELLARFKLKGKLKDGAVNHDKYLYHNPHNL